MTKVLKIKKYLSEINWDNELQEGVINLIVAPTGSGKALQNGTGVLTPTGYKPIESLVVGEEIFGDDGKIYNVSGVYPQGKKEKVIVRFSDGTQIPCSEDHLWNIQTSYQRGDKSLNWQTLSLKEIVEKYPLKVKTGNTWKKHIYIPMVKPLEFEFKEVPVDPYLLGVLLGDGGLSDAGRAITFSGLDLEIVELIQPSLEKLGAKLEKVSESIKHPDYRIKSFEKYKHTQLRPALKLLGILGAKSNNKFIPDVYKYNSKEVRLAILQGLIDTDGYCPGSSYEFVSVSKQLAEDVKFLCESLGLTATIVEKQPMFTYKEEYKKGQIAYRLRIKTSTEISKIHKSSLKGKNWKQGQSSARRTIDEIIKTSEFVEMTCISTTNPNKLFVTEGCVVTHNTFSFVTQAPRDRNTAVVAPFTSITEQIFLSNPDFSLESGMKTLDKINFSNGMITSFHSSARLLEMNNIDLLVIDELHYLINYAGFAYGLINVFWKNVEILRKKFPHMKIVALTATPHFVRLADFLDMVPIVVEQTESTAKPDNIFIGRSWKDEFSRDQSFISLFPSRKIGLSWSKKYHGSYIDSATKDSVAFQKIIEGKMPNKKVFTSTILSTGVSIIEPVDTVYTSWLSLTDIVQMSSRPRLGGHDLKVTQTAHPYYLKDGMDKPDLNFSLDYEKNFKILHNYETWYSWRAHQDETDLLSIIYQMLWRPELTLPELG